MGGEGFTVTYTEERGEGEDGGRGKTKAGGVCQESWRGFIAGVKSSVVRVVPSSTSAPPPPPSLETLLPPRRPSYLMSQQLYLPGSQPSVGVLPRPHHALDAHHILISQPGGDAGHLGEGLGLTHHLQGGGGRREGAEGEDVGTSHPL